MTNLERIVLEDAATELSEVLKEVRQLPEEIQYVRNIAPIVAKIDKIEYAILAVIDNK
jgi:hypothetical protein